MKCRSSPITCSCACSQTSLEPKNTGIRVEFRVLTVFSESRGDTGLIWIDMDAQEDVRRGGWVPGVWENNALLAWAEARVLQGSGGDTKTFSTSVSKSAEDQCPCSPQTCRRQSLPPGRPILCHCSSKNVFLLGWFHAIVYILSEKHVSWPLDPLTHSLQHPYLCIFPATPSSPTISSLKFILITNTSCSRTGLDTCSDWFYLWYSIPSHAGNLSRRVLETGMNPEGGAFRNYLYSAAHRVHTHTTRHSYEELPSRRHNNGSGTGE